MVIKVGTSVLTRPSSKSFDRTVVDQLAAEVARFLKKGIQVSIVSSGAIGAGMVILKQKKRPREIQKLQACAAVGQRYLMQCYEEAFARHGFSTAQVLLTWDDLAKKNRFLNAKRTLTQIQKWRLVPIINENDTVATEEIRFGDNDRLSSLLAILLEADVQVILSDTDGFYAGGLRQQVVRKIDRQIFSHVSDKRNSFTVGGMVSKLRAISTSVSAGVPVFLADGRARKVLTRIFEGEDVGTLFLPDLKKSREGHSWITHLLRHLKN